MSFGVFTQSLQYKKRTGVPVLRVVDKGTLAREARRLREKFVPVAC
ncbi:hypothetical protein SAEN111111_14770 [Saccharibacillus endophyticus]